MEAPEKIYVPTAGDELHYHMTCPNNEFQESIEYIRADAFIKKACEWLGPVFKDLAGYYSGAELLDNFKNYMKGE